MCATYESQQTCISSSHPPEVLDEMHCDGIKINDTYVMALYIFPKPRQVPEAAFGAVLINSSERR